MSVSVELQSEEPAEPPEEDVMLWENGEVVYHSPSSTDEWVMADREDLVSLESMR